MGRRHVVVGGGPAGIFAIETIRNLAPDDDITLVSDEPAYSRMVLPYFMAGEIPEGHVLTGKDRYFERLRVKTVVKRVSRVDPTGKTLTLADKSSVSFDTLLIATGSSPLTLDIPGASGPGVSNLWTLEDARAILARIKGEKAKVVFVGAGFIGFIVLNALAKVGCEPAVVEVEPQILPRMLDRQSAELATKWLAKKGIACHVGVRAAEIGDRGGQKVVALSDGRSLTSDLVVIAVGVRPNVDLLTDRGIRTNHGILVDDHLRTSVPDVYAAGDVAEGNDLSTGKPAVHAIQPTAVEHGRVAGANMAGRAVAYAGSLSMNILDVVKLQAASFGLWRGDGRETTVVENASRPVYRKLVWDGDRIVGAIFLGPADDVALLNDMGMVKGLIQTKTSLGEWKAYIRRNPMDLRRPYVASGVAVKLLEQTLLGAESAERGYRFGDAKPESKPTDAHRVFVSTRPSG
ncbi:MAG: NAD(P)/FAD-dependent oxidoreductase [Candidatus Rokubacteria bacterium]|nr:NAD(P)/FAD-dependent oxidoreductase [Candidatus Rokubacteria bacterium]